MKPFSDRFQFSERFKKVTVEIHPVADFIYYIHALLSISAQDMMGKRRRKKEKSSRV